MTNIAIQAMALIEIDGLPKLKIVIFHGYVSHNQRVYPHAFLIVKPDKLGGEIPIKSQSQSSLGWCLELANTLKNPANPIKLPPKSHWTIKLPVKSH